MENITLTKGQEEAIKVAVQRYKDNEKYTVIAGAGGSANTVYMAVMEVAYGTPYDVYDFDSQYYNLNYEKLQSYQKGANCLHAHAGASLGHSSLKNDEIVIYKEDQCTIKYLVEIGND